MEKKDAYSIKHPEEAQSFLLGFFSMRKEIDHEFLAVGV